MSNGSTDFYQVFSDLIADDFNTCIRKVPEPRVLCYGANSQFFVKRLLPKDVQDTFSTLFTKTTNLDDSFSSDASESLCFICQDSDYEIRKTCELLREKCVSNKIYMIIVPFISTSCEFIVDEFKDLQINLIELHVEIMKMEKYSFLVPSPDCFARCYVNDDVNDVYTIARALTKLQVMNGCPQRVFLAGDMSMKVYEMLEQFKKQVGASYLKADPKYDEMFIIDRKVDLLTPLASQFYYGGLIDEKFNGEYGYIKLPKDLPLVIDDDKQEFETLASEEFDEVYSEICSKTVADVATRLSDYKDEIESMEDKMQNSIGTTQWKVHAKRSQRLAEMKPYVLLHFKLLDKIIHFDRLLKPVMNFEYDSLLMNEPDIDLLIKMMNRQSTLESLRLLCFMSVTYNGIPSNVLQKFQRRLVDEYGYKVAKDLLNLEKSGLLIKMSKVFHRNNLPKLTKINSILNIILNGEKEILYDEDGNPIDNPDIGSGYDTYVPILLRFIQKGLENEWESDKLTEKLLTQMKIPHKVIGEEPVTKYDTNGVVPKRVLVFVIGGITVTESLLLRQMGKILFNDSVEFHVGSTGIINGKSLIKSVCPTINEADNL